MEVYRKIIKNIQTELALRDKKISIKKVDEVLNKYLDYTMDGLFHNAKMSACKEAWFHIKAYPIAYLSKELKRNVLFSSIYSGLIFKITFKWPKMKYYNFTFKPLKRMNYEFKRRVLNTEDVYKLISAYEKSII